ncbi:Ig-like domain-containing protein, partial [Citrobacter meridianamericanus]|uniref:Ig-like domain-containing protein n=1 Tax=Citrobacter meridianamericanus TaxID=2894201 RepID=UPI0039BDB8C3
LTSATSTTDGNGQAIITVKDTTAETATVTAKVGSNTADGGQTAGTAFSLYPVVSGITQGVNNSLADNTTANTLVMQVSDLANNPLPNQMVTLQVGSTGSATLKYKGTSIVGTTGGTVTDTTDSNGQLTLQATDITAETITVNATVSSSTQAVQAATSTFTVYPVISAADTSVTLDGAPSDAVSLNTVQVIVKDLKGNPVSGQDVDWTMNSPAGQGQFTTATTSASDASGVATVSLTNRRMEDVAVTAKVGAGAVAQTQSLTTHFLQYANLSITGLINDSCIVNCTVMVNVNAKDIDGNAIPNLKVATYGGLNLGAQVDGVSVVVTDSSGNAAVARPYAAATTDTGVYAVARSIENPGVISASRSGISHASSEYISPTTTVTTFNPVTITSVSPVNNPYTFAANSGFPKTGFAGAKFKITLSNNNPTAYQWAVDGSDNGTTYTSVEPDGTVTLNSGHSGEQVVQVKDKTSGIVWATYTFTQTMWFKQDAGGFTWTDANAYCTARGQRLPEVSNVTTNGYTGSTNRVVGSLYSEWGSSGSYWSGIVLVWTSERSGADTMYDVSTRTGLVGTGRTDVAWQRNIACIAVL